MNVLAAGVMDLLDATELLIGILGGIIAIFLWCERRFMRQMEDVVRKEIALQLSQRNNRTSKKNVLSGELL